MDENLDGARQAQREEETESTKVCISLCTLQGNKTLDLNNGDNDDVLEFPRCDGCFCRGVCRSTRICVFCGFCFCSDANHALNGVDEENCDEYKADLKTVGDFPDNIRL